jgi:zinc transporter
MIVAEQRIPSMTPKHGVPADGNIADARPESGLIWIYHFQPDGTGELIANEAVDQALENHVGWTWVHLSLADTRCRAWISHNAHLSDLARETLLGPEEHLRLDVLGHEIIGVLPDLQQEIAQPTDAIARMRFAMTERFLISARRSPLHSVETARRAIDAGKRFPTAVLLLDAMIDQFADAVSHMTERLGTELDNIEDRVMHGGSDDERPRVGRLRLQAVRVHRHLAQLRSMFHRLEPRMAHDNAPVAHTIRTLAQKLDAIDNDVHSLLDRIRLMIDEMAAKMTEITNRRLFTLSPVFSV